MKKTILTIIDMGLRAYLGGIFILAAVGKIASPDDFAISIATYQILPLVLINPMALILPWLELITGVGLIIGFNARAQAFLINGMMVVFIIAISIALSKNIEMQCGCFASEEASHELSIMTVYRDLIWLMIGLVIMFAKDNALRIDHYLPCARANNPKED